MKDVTVEKAESLVDQIQEVQGGAEMLQLGLCWGPPFTDLTIAWWLQAAAFGPQRGWRCCEAQATVLPDGVAVLRGAIPWVRPLRLCLSAV